MVAYPGITRKVTVTRVPVTVGGEQRSESSQASGRSARWSARPLAGASRAAPRGADRGGDRCGRRPGRRVGMDDIAAVPGSPSLSSTATSPTRPTCSSRSAAQSPRTSSTEVTAAIDRRSSARKLEAGIEAYIADDRGEPGALPLRAAPSACSGPRSAGRPVSATTPASSGCTPSRVIGEFDAAAGLDSGAAEAWGFGIVGMVRAATDRWLEQQTMSRAALVGYLTDLVWPGLARPYRTASSGAAGSAGRPSAASSRGRR